MTTKQAERPLSPHLQVYRPQITSMLSIMHRITGVALAVGTLFFVGWLWSVAYDPAYFAFWEQTATHPIGRIFLLGWTFALYYHLGNGIRHLAWDTGRGFELKNVTRSGVTVLLFASFSTLATWAWIYRNDLMGVLS